MPDYIYHVASGIFELDGGARAICYSGDGEGKNNVGMQSVAFMGPIPVGSYYIDNRRNDDRHGKDVMPLLPETSTFTFGRGGFMLHGDSIANPGCGSLGCICMPPAARATVRARTTLLVVP
jgi:hypothetical protein